MEVQKEIGQISALHLADWILKHYGLMSHLKLQKLLYYCDAYHLAYFTGRPLVHENFQAWVHGPVCSEVYHDLKGESVLYADVGFKGEGDPDEMVNTELNQKQLELTTEVLDVLSGWKDSELENATHSEWPWIEAREGIPPSQKCNNIISKVTMAEFYKAELQSN